MIKESLKIGVVGAGNMAHFLISRLKDTATPVKHIYLRPSASEMQLAKKFNLTTYTNLSELETAVDILFLLVQDDQIAPLAKQLQGVDTCIYVHCSGTQDLQVFPDHFVHTGIWWPIYSIHKQKLPLHGNIPLVIAAASAVVAQQLQIIASEISNIYAQVSVEEKKLLHLMAVMSNNFITHMAHLTQDFAKDKGIAFDWMKPIIQQTVDNILHAAHIGSLQTGPAIRGDKNTMLTHLSLLDQHPLIRNLYAEISNSIINYNQHPNE